MKEEKDIHTDKTWIRLDKEEIKYGFLSQCIETLAEEDNSDFIEMLDRLENADMTEGYILAHYEVLHTESMENIIEELKEVLRRRESNNKPCYV